jgi:hypothetical protein
VKKSEKEAKEKLRNHGKLMLETGVVPVVTRKGVRIEGQQGQAVKQKFGSGLKDIAASLKKKR